MKIVHIQDYFQPQLGYQETFLPREQSDLGHDVYMLTSDRYKPSLYLANQKLLGQRVIGSGFFIEEGIKVWRLKTLFEIPHAIWVRGLEKKIQELGPDIVVVHGIANFFAIRIAHLKKEKPSFKLIYDDHMAFVASRSVLRSLYPVFRYAFSPLIQQAADALVGVSDTSKMFMHKKYGMPLDRITTIPLGADDELFRFDAAARKEIRNSLSLGEGDVAFIYAGKIIPVKGPHLLVEAAVQLMRDHHNVKVALVGNGPEDYVERMKEEIRCANLEDRFIWHDAVLNRDLYKFYSASDVAVWPRECSLSMLEAMACGLPVIISDSSEATERLEYNNGLTYRGDDACDLARQAEKLLDAELRKEMGSNGRELIEEKLNWRTIARQFIELVS